MKWKKRKKTNDKEKPEVQKENIERNEKNSFQSLL